MSLAVWLPLNGDLYNQGLSDITVTNNGATVDNNGKIGKCYSFDGNSYLQTSSLSGVQSICFWVKLEKKSSLQVVFVDYKSKLAFGFNRNNYIIVSCVDKNIDMYSDTNFPNNAWTHIALVYTSDNSDILLYINGILQTVRLTGNYWVHTTDNLIIGARNNGSIASYMTGYINDFRIYNHALSAKEVEEIAKGLVLHYKLDDQFCESTTNLCNNLKTGGRTVLSTNPLMITTTGENADTYWYVKTSSSLVGGNTYTLSLRCSGLAPGEYFQFGIGAQSGANNCGNFTIYNGYNEKTFTLASGLNGVTQFILDDNSYSSGVRSKRISFYNVQLEAKGHATGYAGVGGNRVATTIYDSSGYSNNGIITGNLTVDSNSIRYGTTTVFPSGGYIRVEKRPAACLPKEALTVNLWQYSTSWSNPISCTEGGGWNFENSSGIRFPVYISGVGYKVAQSSITPASLNNAWHMLTGTMDKDNIKIYIDGEEAGTVTTGSTNGIGYANNYLFISGEASGNSVTPANSNYTGKLSDVRIYATALTPEQIKELYNTSMSIDNNGNIHARELVEL